MYAESWARTKKLLGDAIELTPDHRQEYLEEACGDDLELKNELVTLLDAFEDADDFLEHPISIDEAAFHPGNGESDAGRQLDLQPGTEIGSYRIVESIGRGGMGVVYRARQIGDGDRDVALKVVKPGMDTALILTRFRTEQLALGRMNHPNIAVAYDFGSTPEGRPYFAMEYVQGEPITHYADRNQLDVVARIRLVLDICRGMQHAHRKAIIHRDLKPSNLLVCDRTEGPAVKIIDFGIAKALDQDGATSTVPGASIPVGTPEYMSPEQATGGSLAVDTRTDVYSIGVVLFELLTGSPPFARKGESRKALDKFRHQLLESPPRTPSTVVKKTTTTAAKIARAHDEESIRTLSKKLRGDLDWIALKALAKDPDRRYESPAALAEDLERHLENRPVSASPPSKVYAARKFVRRNRVAVATAVVLAAALSFGVGGSWRARQHQLQEKRLVDQTRKVFQDLFVKSNPNLPGVSLDAEDVLEQVLKQAETTVHELSERPKVVADLLYDIARLRMAYRDHDAAEQLALEIRAHRESELGAGHPDVATAIDVLAWVAGVRDDSSRSLELYRESLQIRKAALPEDDVKIAIAWSHLGAALGKIGEYEEAQNAYETSLSLLEKFHPENDTESATVHHNFSWLLQKRQNFPAAELHIETALELRSRKGDDTFPVGRTLEARGRLRSTMGRQEEAEVDLRTALKIFEKTLPPGNLTIDGVLNSLGTVAFRNGEYDEALTQFTRAYKMRLTRYGPDHRRVANSQSNISESHLKNGEFDKAEENYRAAISRYKAVQNPDSADLVEPLTGMAAAVAAQGRLSEAEQLYRQALDASDNSPTSSPKERASAQEGLSALLRSLGRDADADAVQLDNVSSASP